MRTGFVLPMGEDTRPGVPALPREILAMARDVEAAGFDSVWTFDHLLMVEVDRFAEAMEIISAMIRDGQSTFDGAYYRTEDARLLPEAPPGRATMPILVGGRGPACSG